VWVSSLLPNGSSNTTYVGQWETKARRNPQINPFHLFLTNDCFEAQRFHVAYQETSLWLNYWLCSFEIVSSAEVFPILATWPSSCCLGVTTLNKH
jgi:hypothetical protein